VKLAPRWAKAIGDVVGRPGRSLLVILAMTAGLFEMGAMLTKYTILHRELSVTYARTRPASAVLVTDAVDDRLVEAVRHLPGIEDAEARPVIAARVRVSPDEWSPAALFVVPNFDDQHLDVFAHDLGAWPPKPGQVLIERSSLSVARALVGDSLTFRAREAGETPLEIAGTVHAAGLAPGWMDHVVIGFVGADSPLAGAAQAQLRIAVSERPLDRRHIRDVAGQVAAWLGDRGHPVTRITVPEPGRHPHAAQMDTFTYLIGAFGVLSFLLGVILVATMIHALLIEQVREIGIMKAIGATTRQVAGIYLAEVALLAAASLVLAIPLGWAVGQGYAKFAASILNAEITDSSVPWWVYGLEVAVGLLVPLLVSLIPVWRASRVTAREAMSGPSSSPQVAPALAALAGVSRPLLWSLRTTLAHRVRLGLTVTTLALGGAVFMSAINVGKAYDRAVDRDFATRRYNIAVGFARPEPVATIADALATVPGIARAECWPEGAGSLGADGLGAAQLALVGPDLGSPMLALSLAEGRWLRPGDVCAAVINRAVQALDSTLQVGRPIQLLVNGRTVSWPIVGVVQEMSPHLAVYAPPGAVREATGQPEGFTRSVRVATRSRDAAAELGVARELQRTFERLGIEVTGMQRMLDMRQAILDHLVIIKTILAAAAILVVLVGGLALALTLTLAVIQRTRELGILSAIGAAPRTLAFHVWIESVLIGLLSWAAAVILAVPVSAVLESVCGQMFFRMSLGFYLSPWAATIWLGLVVVLATVSSLAPARRAARLTIREALAYE